MSNQEVSVSHDRMKHEVVFFIEGKEFTCSDQFITGRQLKNLAGISLDAELYLSINEPFKDELIKNDENVDLARPGLESFYVKRDLEYIIDGNPFKSSKQFIKGSEIRKEGKIDASYDIYLSIKGPWEDEQILDNGIVDLARPGIENFYSCKPNTTHG
jgi:hypothetical protein